MHLQRNETLVANLGRLKKFIFIEKMDLFNQGNGSTIRSMINPVKPSDATHTQSAFLELLRAKLNNSDNINFDEIVEFSSKAFEEYKADIKKYPAAISETHTILLLKAKYAEIQETKKAALAPRNIPLQLIALKSKLEYRKALYTARIAGNEKRGYDAGFLYSFHYSATAKEKAASAMITAIQLYMTNRIFLLHADLKQFDGAANNGKMKDILIDLKILKIWLQEKALADNQASGRFSDAGLHTPLNHGLFVLRGAPRNEQISSMESYNNFLTSDAQRRTRNWVNETHRHIIANMNQIGGEAIEMQDIANNSEAATSDDDAYDRRSTVSL